MIDLKLQHRRARRFHSANFNFTLAKAALDDSSKLSSSQQKLVKAPIAGKIAFGLITGLFIALVAIQLI